MNKNACKRSKLGKLKKKRKKELKRRQKRQLYRIQDIKHYGVPFSLLVRFNAN
jgi:hypothetical protein